MKQQFDVFEFLGEKHNSWTIKAFSRFDKVGVSKKRTVVKVIAECDCGTEREVILSNILRGLSKCCGCSGIIHLVKRSLIHGHATRKGWTKEHRIWCGMMKRCYYEGDKHYGVYGGAGIIVCERWHDFRNFISDMGMMPEGKKSIDRFPNKSGNYEPDNCKWADDFEQSRNRRNNINVTVNGEVVTAREAEKILGLPKDRIQSRLKRGYTIDEAINLPPHAKNRKEYRK